MEVTWSSCLSLCSRQLAREVWRLQCQERLGLGTGLRAWGAGVRHAALHPGQEDKRGFASQLAKPAAQRLTNAPPLTFLQSATIHFLSLSQAVNQYPLLLWTITVMSQGTVCKVGTLSQMLSIYSGQWDGHACTQTHTFQSFSGNHLLSNLPFIFVVFNCYHGLSITLHLGMLPPTEQKKTYFLSFRDFQ